MIHNFQLSQKKTLANITKTRINIKKIFSPSKITTLTKRIMTQAFNTQLSEWEAVSFLSRSWVSLEGHLQSKTFRNGYQSAPNPFSAIWIHKNNAKRAFCHKNKKACEIFDTLIEKSFGKLCKICNNKISREFTQFWYVIIT